MPDVTMPQLGETVTEGTITKWYKAVGDQVSRDEPLFEVSTDKVDSEVPSPAEGVLTAILVEEGDTVDVGVTLAVIGGSRLPPRRPLRTGTAPPPAPAPRHPLRPQPPARTCSRTGDTHSGPSRPAPPPPPPRRSSRRALRRHRPITTAPLHPPPPPSSHRRHRPRAGSLPGGAQAAQRARHRSLRRSPAPDSAVGSPGVTSRPWSARGRPMRRGAGGGAEHRTEPAGSGAVTGPRRGGRPPGISASR